jgi:hypothetical protein
MGIIEAGEFRLSAAEADEIATAQMAEAQELSLSHDGRVVPRVCRSSQQVDNQRCVLRRIQKAHGYCPVVRQFYRLHASLKRKAEYEWQGTQFYTYPIMDPAAVRSWLHSRQLVTIL